MYHPYLKKAFLSALILFTSFFVSFSVNAQMRQVYLDNLEPSNKVWKISFYTPSEGFVAFDDWIGYTADSGRTFIKRYITNNVNYNGYLTVNTLAGFWIEGVKAFDQNKVIAYGSYGGVPAILSSTNGGVNYTLVYHSQFNNLQLLTGIKDMIFPQNNTVGYAVDADRILKTTNQGLSWTVVRTDPARYFDYLEAVDNNNVFAMSVQQTTNRLVKTTNAGASWQTVVLPVLSGGKLTYTHFLTASIGWLCMYDNDHKNYTYKTINGGTSWTLQNNIFAVPFAGKKLKFFDENIGFALAGQNTVYKTFDGGVTWEPLARDNNFSYLGYSHNDLQCLSATQLWAGGDHGFLEMSNNGGGTPLPKAYFLIDTVGVSATSNVNLINYSRTGYTYKWYKNNILIGNTYNTNYSHNINSYTDSIKLVVFNGTSSDSVTKYQNFNVPPPPPPPTMTSFSPLFGNTGNTINIYGTNFTNVSSVKFGGLNAASFTVISSTQIAAILDSGTTGTVKVTTAFGSDSLSGFSHLRPSIISFSPTSGGPGTVVTISGGGFDFDYNTRVVKFGGTVAASMNGTGSNFVNAVVGNGTSGNITFTNIYGTASLGGFTYIPPPPPPHITSFTPTQAAQGATVTITGTNFINVTSVKFGIVEATSFNVLSPTTIAAVVGTGSDGKVFVTTGTGLDSLAGFVYTTPIISSVLPSVGTTGSVVTITGSNFNGTTSVTFGGTAAASFTVNNSTSITAVIGAGSTGNVTITSPNGTFTVGGFVFLTNNIPVINSFSPIAGSIGSTVQIIGTGFSNIAANNIVYFGATKAVVSAATPTLLTVIVPSGATYQNISVTTNGLTCSSKTAFTITFPNGILTENTFATNVSFPTKYQPANNYIEDFDDDGLPDVIIGGKDTLSIYKNTTVANSYSLSNRIDIPTMSGTNGAIEVADINGDGKKDIIYKINDSFFVYRNNSVVGSISFMPKQNLGISDNNGFFNIFKIADFNNDGKPDIAFMKASGFVIYLNTSNVNNISFLSTNSFATSIFSNSAYSLAIADLDGDGKQDIAISYYYGSANTAVSVFKNVSNGTLVSFILGYSFGVSGWYANIKAKDIDADGKPDLLYNNFGYYQNNTLNQVDNGKITVLRNTSLGNTLTFSQSFISSIGQTSITEYGNLDGDDKTDLVGYEGTTSFAAIKNNSSIGNVNTNLPFQFTLSNLNGVFRNVSVADMNSDGKPDVIICSINEGKIYIFKHKDSALSINACANTNKLINSNLNGASYQWQVNTGLGFVNIIDGVNYSGTTTHDLQIINTLISYNNYQYKCLVGTGSSSVFILTVNPSVVPSLNIITPDTTICIGSPITFRANSINGGSIPNYMWQVNGINSGISSGGISSTYTTSNITNNSQIRCILTSNASCINQQTAVSNTVQVSIGTNLVPSIAISQITPNICAGSSTVFTATTTNGGIVPSYQWQVNGINAGTNSNTFTTNTLTNNAQVKCILTSNATCTSPQTATSNLITVIVNPILVPSISISSTATNICSGTLVTFNATITNGGLTPVYQWQVNGVNVGANSNTFTSATLSNNAQIKCILTSNAPCATPQTISSNIITVTVNPVVIPTVSISTTSTTICPGESTTFTATAINGGTTPSYQWQVNGVNVGSNANIFTSNSLTNGAQVKCIFTSNAPCATSQTAISNIIAMVVNTSAVVPTITINTTATNICSGSPATFTAISTNGGTTPTYQWQVNGINVGTNTNTFTTNALTNNTQVKCILTSNAACASPQTATSNVLSINVNPIVVPTISIASTITSICTGSPITFTATGTNTGTTPSYQWQVNGINAGANSNTFTSTTLTNNAQVKCILTSNTACANPQIVTSNLIIVAVNSVVVPIATITATDTTICSGTSITFTATPTNGGTTPSYQWQVNGVNAGTNTNTFTSSTLTNASNVKVIMTSSLACAAPQTATSHVINITVNNTVIPTASFTSSATNICNGASITFTSTSTNVGTLPIYQWKKNGVNVGTNAPTFTSNGFVNGDAITLTLTSNAACASNTALVSNPVTIMVATDVPTITIAGNTTVVVNNSTNITSTVTFGGTLPTYQWQDSTNLHTWANISGATSSSLAYTPSAVASGNKVRCVMTSNSTCALGITATSNALTFNVTPSIAPPPNSNGEIALQYYPNPVRTILTIDSLKVNDQWESLSVMSANGSASIANSNIIGKTKVTINVENLSAGMYLIVLRRKEGSPAYLKFIKE
jgi:hypothetical protein